MRVTVGRALAAGAAILALVAPATAMASSADATQVTGVAHAEAGGAPPEAGRATDVGRATGPRAPAASHVVLVGIGGLRWSDISPTATPALWRLAGLGSVGSLVVSGIHTRTCPADGWLTLNAAARAAVPHAATGPCPAGPAVTVQPSRGHPGAPSPARVPRMPGLVAYNDRFHYNPQWGLLAAAPGAAGTLGAAGRLPRSTTVSGQRARVAAVSAAADGRYAATLPSGLASASAAPGPTAVAHRPGPGGPAAAASRPHWGL